MSKNKVEIERRWLLKFKPTLDNWDEVIVITQYYLSDKRRIRASRIIEDVTYELCSKTPVEGSISNIEVEENISREQFNEYLRLANKKISKVRYKKDGWEIDVFIGIRLVIAEFEIQSEDQEIIIPDWLQPFIIKEITGEKEFSNYNLSEEY